MRAKIARMSGVEQRTRSQPRDNPRGIAALFFGEGLLDRAVAGLAVFAFFEPALV